MHDTPAALTVTAPAALAVLDQLDQQAQEYARRAIPENTRRAYAADWRAFSGWCDALGLAALPAAPSTIARYITALADEGLTYSTISRRLASVTQAHRLAGQLSPCQDAIVQLVRRGVKRTIGARQQGKAPIMADELRVICGALGDDLGGQRDRALLLIGFAGAFRRSELVGLDVADLRWSQQGVAVTVRRSKTDQGGEGLTKAIPYGLIPASCPVRALRAWLDAAGITEGPIFRGLAKGGRVRAGRLSDRAVALIVKRSAALAGIDPAALAGHSLRAGLATSAAAAGVSERSIMRQTGHKSIAVARRYIRDGELWRDNAAGAVL